MYYPMRYAFLLFLILCLCSVTLLSQGLINVSKESGDPGNFHIDGLDINHTCTDVSQVPHYWINSGIEEVEVHYAYSSHGAQIMTGLNRLRNHNGFDYHAGAGYLPTSPGLSIYTGQNGSTWVYPEGYWYGETGRNYTRNVLNSNPTINVTMWSWCTHLNWYTATY